MNMGQDRQMQMVGGNGGNQFREYVGQNVGNQNGYNAVQNVRNQVVQNAVKNLSVYNVENQNGLIVVPRIANQNPNGNGNVVIARAEGNAIGNNARIQLQPEEFDLMAAAVDLDEIEEVNANCILMANLQQALILGTQIDKAPVYDTDRSVEEIDKAEPAEVEEVIEVVTAAKLMTEVVTTATTTITAALVPKAKHVKRKERQDNTVMRYEALKRKPVTEAQARKNMMIYLKNMAGFRMDFFKEEEESKRKSENLKQKAAKKQKIDEEVPDIDYQIHHEHNKPYYKIIRADETHQLFLSFITLLRNFDREDLEMLWKLVQERFQSSEPKNFLDDFLLRIFRIMFKKPNVEVSIWEDQRGRYGLAKVKS
nr:hypothetical protein [Tanacetum cinerariifolium]